MDGFFLSIFLAVCVVVAVLMRCICYRSSCVRRVLSSNDDIILPRRAAPVITPSRSQQQQHNPQISDDISDSPIIPHNGAVFTIYTFEQQPSPLLQRSSRLVDPPKYSSLPVDAPPKYEDLFPMVELCTSCKVNMSLPPVPLHDAHPVHTPASSNSPTTVPGVSTCSAHSPCSALITNSDHISSSTIGHVSNSSSTASLASSPSTTTRLANTSSTTSAAHITDAAVSPVQTSTTSPPITRSILTNTVSPAHNTLSTGSTLTSNTIHSHRSGLSEEDSPLNATTSLPSDGE